MLKLLYFSNKRLITSTNYVIVVIIINAKITNVNNSCTMQNTTFFVV